KSECASKLAPRISGSFSARFTRAITHSVIGLPFLLDDCARGGAAVFPAGKMSVFPLKTKKAGLFHMEKADFTCAKRKFHWLQANLARAVRGFSCRSAAAA
ncbi:MAG: hypothetical protein II343_07895, partial [Clostridia bacterium]|nr:hypothetical protein [Clostridia bacterium]